MRLSSHHILLGRLVESLVAGELLAWWQTSVELYLLHLERGFVRSNRLIQTNRLEKEERERKCRNKAS